MSKNMNEDKGLHRRTHPEKILLKKGVAPEPQDSARSESPSGSTAPIRIGESDRHKQVPRRTRRGAQRATDRRRLARGG